MKYNSIENKARTYTKRNKDIFSYENQNKYISINKED